MLFARVGRAVDVHHFAGVRNAGVGHQNEIGSQVLGRVLGLELVAVFDDVLDSPLRHVKLRLIFGVVCRDRH